MFEDSSSDEDEVNVSKTTPNDDAKADEDKKKPSLDDDDDDDGDEDDDDKKESEKTEEKKKPTMAGLFDDSDDDEEFDDAGAVVGSSAPPSAKKTSESEEPVGGASDTPKKERINRTQNASVLEAERPEDGTSLHMTKLPNVVAIQPNAFDEADYDEKEEEEQYKGYMHNMIRWRYKKDQNGALVREGEDKQLVRESNTKMVKWSDGSFTLHIGNEAFDIQNVDSSKSNGFPGLNGYVYLSQKATFENGEDDDEEEGVDDVNLNNIDESIQFLESETNEEMPSDSEEDIDEAVAHIEDELEEDEAPVQEVKKDSKKKKKKKRKSTERELDPESEVPTNDKETVINDKRKKKKKKKNDQVLADAEEEVVITLTEQQDAKKKDRNAKKKLKEQKEADETAKSESAQPTDGSRHVSFGKKNRAKSHKASMNALRTSEPPSTKETVPEKGILRKVPRHSSKNSGKPLSKKQRKKATSYF
mmetsp:Transcript_10673/g.26962  ORF Transcript_10673/g.26962 Transcript_10673/m.26962 type:complete len:475 (+) Transcript_10673:128-1552(+)